METGREAAAVAVVPPLDAGRVAALKARLDWVYPFSAAVVESAKTTVTALRRRAVDDQDDEARKLFQPAAARLKPSTTESRSGAARLSATEIGTAHHAFMQLVALERTGSEAELRAEAERLQRACALTAEQTNALNFPSLAGFWQSGLGRSLREQPVAQVHRELQFTARLGAADLRTLALASEERRLGADEFVVVQGAVDLAVLAPEEIWIVDFKTDAVTTASLPDKVKAYRPQLQLYALALSRIYQRPVTQTWLHFFALNESVRVA
jgi:ATP-dependent helicase/nuclease subunit A